MSAIEIENLFIKYRGQSDYALQGVNLRVKNGEFVGIIGPTGAGKSSFCTTLNGLIPNLIKPEEFKGDVTIFGLNTKEHTVAELSQHVGIVFQDFESQLFCTTVLLETSFGPGNLGLPREEILKRVDESLKWTRLTGFEKRYTYSLSGGEKQRLAIAATLSMHPTIIVLDEATADLDPVGKLEIYQIAKQFKEQQTATMVIVDHHLDRLAEIADRIVVLNNGQIIYDGKPREVFSHVDELIEMGLRPPQVTELFFRLGIKDEYPLDVNEAINRFPQNYKVTSPPKAISENFETRAIEIRNLSHTYDGEFWALKGINVTIGKGEFVGVIGPNGSGKTTFAQCINGIVRPTKGSIKLFGEEATIKSVSELGKIVGYVFQNPDYQIFSNTVREEFTVGPRSLGLPSEEVNQRLAEMLKTLGIENLANEDPFFLSKANRERVAVGAVLTLKPEIVILDEPTTGLSPGEVKKMMELAKSLNEQGKTIVAITHDMWVVAQYCKRVLVLHNGELQLDGPTQNVFSQIDLLKKFYVEPPQVCRFSQAKFGETFLTIEELMKHVTLGG